MKFVINQISTKKSESPKKECFSNFTKSIQEVFTKHQNSHPAQDTPSSCAESICSRAYFSDPSDLTLYEELGMYVPDEEDSIAMDQQQECSGDFDLESIIEMPENQFQNIVRELENSYSSLQDANSQLDDIFELISDFTYEMSADLESLISDKNIEQGTGAINQNYQQLFNGNNTSYYTNFNDQENGWIGKNLEDQCLPTSNLYFPCT